MELQSSQGLLQWHQDHTSYAVHGGCPGAARADVSGQPMWRGKDSTSTGCGFCYYPLELVVALVAPKGQRLGQNLSLAGSEGRSWPPSPAALPPASLPSSERQPARLTAHLPLASGSNSKPWSSDQRDQTPFSSPWSLSPERSPCAAAPPPFSHGPPWRPGARHSARSGGSKGGRGALVTQQG